MKILLFINNDIHALKALRILCPQIKGCEVKIILSQNVGKVLDLPDEIIEMKKVEKVGVDDLLKKIVQELQAQVGSFDDVNSSNSLDELKKFAADLAISIRFGQIFKADLIKLFPLGVLNLHSGILPKYRGVLASFWAILNQEKKLGTTLHYVRDAGIDTGDVIGFSEITINWDKTLVENIAEIYQGGCELLIEVLKKINLREEIKTINQKELGEGGYFSYPKREDVERFLKVMRVY